MERLWKSQLRAGTRQRLKTEQAPSPDGERLSEHSMEQWNDNWQPLLGKVCLNSLLQGSQSTVYTFSYCEVTVSMNILTLQ